MRPEHKEHIGTFTCHECDHEWEAPMHYELGGWHCFDDEDEICSECGNETTDITISKRLY